MTKQKRKMARVVRQMARSLGPGLPDNWTDRDVLQFMQQLLVEHEHRLQAARRRLAWPAGTRELPATTETGR